MKFRIGSKQFQWKIFGLGFGFLSLILALFISYSLSAQAPRTFEQFFFAKNKSNSMTHSVLIWVDGKIIYEKHIDGFSRDVRWQVWSMSKSFLGALVGMGVQEGKLSLQDSICQHGIQKHCEIKVEHLLRWQSCLHWREDYEATSSPAASDVVQMLYGQGLRNAVEYVLNRDRDCEPGSNTKYSSGDSNLLAAVLANAYGDQFEDFRIRFFTNLGIKNPVWEKDAAGNLIGSSYLYISVWHALQLGLLYLNNGVVNGQQILPKDWVQRSRETLKSSDTIDVEGMHWWVYKDSYAAEGHWGQMVLVIPSKKSVIVRFGNTRDDSFKIPEVYDLAMELIP